VSQVRVESTPDRLVLTSTDQFELIRTTMAKVVCFGTLIPVSLDQKEQVKYK
jgi:hypothetical protein